MFLRIILAAGVLAAALGRRVSAQDSTAVAPPGSDHPAVPAFGPLPTDTFAHVRHQRVPCLRCHLSSSGARLTFERPVGCRDCHHGRQHRDECGRCHRPEGLPDTLQFRFAVAAAGRQPLEREVAFPHRHHAALPCTSCHGETASRAPVDSAANCRGCHDQHHDIDRACAVCHRTPRIMATHAAPARPHVACDACHAPAVIDRLTPTRSLCLACHGIDVDHQPGRECTVCHMQSPAAEYRRLLTRGERR